MYLVSKLEVPISNTKRSLLHLRDYKEMTTTKQQDLNLAEEKLNNNF